MSQIYKVEKIKLKKCSFFEMQVVFIMKVEDRLQQKRKNFVAGLQEIVSVKRETVMRISRLSLFYCAPGGARR
ncbi:MAG: hypothetical protein UDS45_09640 [Lachnospiraceae bacterium]|jgi:hypothetical protein|nr:hypothetical protein [Lachnospiraceae bacterium]